MKIIKIYSHKQPIRCSKTLHKITQKATAMENNSNKTTGRKFRHLKRIADTFQAILHKMSKQFSDKKPPPAVYNQTTTKST